MKKLFLLLVASAFFGAPGAFAGLTYEPSVTIESGNGEVYMKGSLNTGSVDVGREYVTIIRHMPGTTAPRTFVVARTSTGDFFFCYIMGTNEATNALNGAGAYDSIEVTATGSECNMVNVTTSSTNAL